MLAINLICFSSFLNLWFSYQPLCMYYLYEFWNSICYWWLTQLISLTSMIQSFYCFFFTIDILIAFLLRIMNWNFLGLAIIWLPLNDFHAIFRSDSRFSVTSFTDLTKLHMVSSSKLQMSVFLTKHNMSLTNVLENIGPRIESCGTSRRIFNHELKWKQVWLFVFDLRDSLVKD